MKELQAKLDELIEECGDTHKISGKKIVQIKDSVLKTVLRVSSSRYDSYVCEKGALYNNADYDYVLKPEFVELLKGQTPKEFVIMNQDDEFTFSHIEFDGVKIDLKNPDDVLYAFSTDHMEEFEKLVFVNTDIGYALDLEKSGIVLGDDQGDCVHFKMEILDVARCQKSIFVEEFE
jgi:hypothetical protein